MHVSRTSRVRDVHRGLSHDPRSVLEVIVLVQREMGLGCVSYNPKHFYNTTKTTTGTKDGPFGVASRKCLILGRCGVGDLHRFTYFHTRQQSRMSI